MHYWYFRLKIDCGINSLVRHWIKKAQKWNEKKITSRTRNAYDELSTFFLRLSLRLRLFISFSAFFLFNSVSLSFSAFLLFFLFSAIVIAMQQNQFVCFISIYISRFQFLIYFVVILSAVNANTYLNYCGMLYMRGAHGNGVGVNKNATPLQSTHLTPKMSITQKNNLNECGIAHANPISFLRKTFQFEHIKGLRL